MDDWEYSEKSCPKCQSQLAWRSCSGCEQGYYEDEDGINGDTLERCDACNGKGYEEWCRECGWDNVFKCFLSPQYEAEWQAKQAASRPSGCLKPWCGVEGKPCVDCTQTSPPDSQT